MDQSPASPSVREYLERKLPSSVFNVLAQASREWTQPLFSYDALSESFEPAIESDDDPAPEVIEAICIAVETLSGYRPKGKDDPLIQPEESAGFAHLTYEFDVDEAEVFDRFKWLLEENVSPDAGFVAQFQNEPWGARATITLTYLSDFDYQRKKDTIDTMLVIARKWVEGTPFLGEKI